MDISLSPPEQATAEEARALFGDWADRHRGRELPPAGYDPELLDTVAARGWLDGRSQGAALTTMAVVSEALGAHLVPGPFQSSLVQAAAILDAVGDHQRAAAVASGAAIGAWVEIDEALECRRQGSTWTLSGQVPLIPYGDAVGPLVVTWGATGGPDWVVVDRGAPGIELTPQPSLARDGTVMACLDSTTIGDAQAGVLSATEARAKAVALVAQAAELVGLARGALDIACDWVRTRHQWGQPIGTLQAVQHRAADLLTLIEVAWLTVADAAGRADRDQDFIAVASAAKITAARAALAATAGAHQLHGGEGYYEDRALGAYFRRARAATLRLGSPAEHRRMLTGAGPGVILTGLLGQSDPESKGPPAP